MDSDFFYSCILEHLKKRFPKLPSNQLENFPVKKMASPYVVQVPQEILDKAKKLIEVLFRVSRSTTYKALVESGCDDSDKEILNFNSANLSVLMGYDFHIDPSSNSVKLIEINTNGAGFLFTDLIYQCHELQTPYVHNPMSSLKESFLREFQSSDSSSKSMYIMDENINSQKMLFEFYLYKELFSQWGFKSEIVDVEDLNLKADLKYFIYNRFCDFLLREEKSKELRAAYLNSSCTLSPNPKEYLLLGDKSRLIQLSDEKFLSELNLTEEEQNLIRESIPKSFDSSHFKDADELWSQRKKYFFKPKRSHGGKSSYRGKSMTKSVFSRMLKEDCLIQEVIPPPTFTSTNDLNETTDWKYDLRIYTYGHQIQQVVARLYQGQVTNFNKEFGGFAAVKST